MALARHGLKKAIVGLVSGLVTSALIDAFVLSEMGESGRNIAFLINVTLMLLAVAQLERAKYWGIMYSLGYFMGIILIGQYLMETWELLVYAAILAFYIIRKIARRASRR